MTKTKNITKQEAICLLKAQRQKIRNTVAKMPHDAPDVSILRKISKCKLIKTENYDTKRKSVRINRKIQN